MKHIDKSLIVFLLITGISLMFFAGCGTNGSESLQSLNDIRNPDIVKNVQVFPLHRKVRFSWDADPNPNIIGYKIYRATGGAIDFVEIATVSQMPNPWYLDEGDDQNKDGIGDGLENNVLVYYKITGLDRNGRESPVGSSAGYPAIPGSVILEESINIGVQDIKIFATYNQVFLAWTPVVHTQLSGYNVYRSTSGQNSGMQKIAYIPKEQSSFIDGGVSPSEGYRYEVSPVFNQLSSGSNTSISAGFLEGLRSQSKIANPRFGNATIPKPPGSSPLAAFGIKAEVTVLNSSSGVLLQFTRPTGNIDGSTLPDHKTGEDDLINGAYLIFRSDKLYGKYDLVGIVENVGSQSISDYFDPYGKDSHYYYVLVGDSSGNLSDRSDIASALAAVPPATVRDPVARASESFGGIVISFGPNSSTGTDSNTYNIYRSTEIERGYVAIRHGFPDEDPLANKIQFTDLSPELMIGQTYYYKVSVSRNGMESSLSSPAAASPGPARGLVVLQGENAAIWISPFPGAQIPPANHPGQFWPDHWVRSNTNGGRDLRIFREGLHAPYLGNGVLKIEPQEAASASIIKGERVDLEWRVDIRTIVDPTSPGLTPLTTGTVTADVWLFTADDESTGQYKIFLDSPSEIVLANGLRRNSPPGQDGFFNGIQAEINFRDSSTSRPLRPNRRMIGTMNFNFLNDTGTNGLADTETVYMSIVHSGPVGTASNFGSLKLDALVLVIH
ncbi:MAG: hypothetical protein H3C47_12260 [Candidatus Cloacimonetes bacterium]|nr:hypothetical protein [Candidatus Cloacimonadota bacterium]